MLPEEDEKRPSISDHDNTSGVAELPAEPILSRQLPVPLDRSFPIVGVGASAGGLEALERLFDQMPADSGMAFVIVQHLSPDFKSLMDELLGRRTKIRVCRVSDGMAVQPNAIYLIPPKKEMIISEGRLLLTDKDPVHGLALPIDIFLRSLAQDAGARSVAIILSGTGSDGSRGIRDIHEAGGLVMVQSEETAKFDGMPRSAVDTGVVDFVLPPEAMPDILLKCLERPGAAGREAAKLPAVSEVGMNAIFKLLRREYGIDFSHYKPNTVTRRVERRLLLNQSADLDHYVERLMLDGEELNSLYKDLLIGVTKFFRDREAFERLGAEILPSLIRALRRDDELRIWVAGCATGEEAYSVAILVDEAFAAEQRPLNAKIFATDVHRASLDFASAGVYPGVAFSEVAPARLERYFMRQGSGYHVAPDLRRMIVFAPHNLIKDAPFTRLDLVTCRNLLIYFQPQAQKKVLSLFHFGLKTGGVLFLGPSESPSEVAEEFDTLDEHWKLYRKRRDIRLASDVRLPLMPGYTQPRPTGQTHPLPGMPDLSLLRAYDSLLEEYVPPSMLVNDRRELLHSFSGAGIWLRPPDGRPSRDILDMVHKDLRAALTGAIQRATKDLSPVVYTGVTARLAEGEQQIKLTVKPIAHREADSPYLLISLEAMSPKKIQPAQGQEIDVGQVSRDQLHTLESELRYTKENLQATIEELETSNEELQATNEELVASNEELQSTNEELHSVNEELYTVNGEYQRKIAELTELTDDMDNLLRSTDIGTIFLDAKLTIRKFTPQIAQSFHILPQDVGRRIDSFTHSIDHPNLMADLEAVLGRQTRVEREVRDRQGKSFLLRILPYQSKQKTEGVVLTLIDVNTLKQAEKDLRLMSKVFMDAADPIIIEDLDGRIIDLNSEAERVYGWKREELLGRYIDLLMPREVQDTSKALRERCRKSEAVRNVDTVRLTKWGETRAVLLTLSLLTDESGGPIALASIAKDITTVKQAEEERARYATRLERANDELRDHISSRRKAEEQAREAVRRRDHFLAMLSHELRNPLASVLNAVYVLEHQSSDGELRQQAQTVIHRQARQMARLLDDLLDVSRVTQNRIVLRKEIQDLTTTVKDAVAAVRPMIDERQQTLHVECPDTPVWVYGDPSRLQQIQVNLLTNASKYTPPGGSIRLAVEAETDSVAIRVRDTGEGIPAEMLDAVFDLFVQSGSTLDRSDGGMGVGLTLVRGLVELHGGSVQAFSEGVGCGSEFTVRLPLSASPLPQKRRDTVLAPPGRRCRLVLVEDNADNREILRSLLELDGYRVTVAEDGPKGLEAITRERPEVALIDIGLPGLDGYQVARRLRANAETSGIRLVALTGYGRPEDREAVLQAGFDAHLVKPPKPEELYRALETSESAWNQSDDN